MDCAAFESTLQRVISGEIEGPARDQTLSDLTRHAESCSTCEGVIDLLEWLALPGTEMDMVEDPGDVYWDGFNDRVRRRIANQPTGVASQGTGWKRWAGAAVAVVLVSAFLWIAFGPTDDAPATRTANGKPTSELPRTTLELPDSLVEIIERDPAALREVGFGEDAGWPGAHDGEGWVFPDTEDLDPAARDELLEWLRERTPDGAGVRS